ncbi:olfactory receptor 10A7-like [Lithobates pipiens]
MTNVNKTVVKEFILLGFSSFYKLQNSMFYVVLLAYIVCVIGNITIIILVRAYPTLQTPMYFFISTFAFLEILFVSVTVPKLLAILISTDGSTSVIGCFLQVYIFHALGEAECFLLALMVFDRYLAINNPLHYSTIMNGTFCLQLAALPWIFGFIISFMPAIVTMLLEYCGPNKIDHFFCDLAPLQRLACSDLFLSNVTTVLAAFLSVITPFISIVVLYIQILCTVLKIRGISGKKKAFSTCSSHLIVASMFYGSAIIVYSRPSGSHYDKFLALMYTVVTPLLNPFIYTLRNTDVKDALRKLIKQHLIKPNG